MLSKIYLQDGGVTAAETPRERLARLMDERRVELGLLWNEVAEAAGLTKEGLRRIRHGTARMQLDSKRGIEKALQWTRGSIDAVLVGGEPTAMPRQVTGTAAGAATGYATVTDSATARDELTVEKRPAGDELSQRPGESGFDYLDRMYSEWQKIRRADEERDRLRERVIREALRDERDAG